MSAANSRETGRSMVRSATGMVAVGAVVGTAGLAFYVGHAYGGTTKSSGQSSSSQTPSQTYGDGSWSSGGQSGYPNPYGDDGQRYPGDEGRQYYGDQGQTYGGGYVPSPGTGGAPQARTGGS